MLYSHYFRVRIPAHDVDLPVLDPSRFPEEAQKTPPSDGLGNQQGIPANQLARELIPGQHPVEIVPRVATMHDRSLDLHGIPYNDRVPHDRMQVNNSIRVRACDRRQIPVFGLQCLYQSCVLGPVPLVFLYGQFKGFDPRPRKGVQHPVPLDILKQRLRVTLVFCGLVFKTCDTPTAYRYVRQDRNYKNKKD